MRISDWSSDVCSSDLTRICASRQRCGKWDHNHLRGDHCAWLSPESRSRQRHSGRCTGAVLTVDLRTIAETGATNADLLSLTGDRKSDVKGKRVVVRVDPVGGRSIKNKTLTNQKNQD